MVLALLPPAFLGAAYVLFVEFTLRDALPPGSLLPLTLRTGGIALAAISLVFAAACGYLLAERFLRPLRLILRLAESGDVQPGRADSLGERGREYLDLHRLLRVLVKQNQTGARAMEELDQLRAALARFREEISRTGVHGIQPEVTASGPLREVALHVQAKRHHLLSFFRDLHERVGHVRVELEGLGAQLGLEGAAADTEGRETGSMPPRTMPVGTAETGGAVADVPQVFAETADEQRDSGGGTAANEVEASLERLRRLGTVLALESARAGGVPARRAAEMLDRFHAGLGDLEVTLEALPGAVRGNGDLPAVGPVPSAIPDANELRERWRRLLEGIESIERRLEEVEER
jgi:hypothetical protein